MLSQTKDVMHNMHKMSQSKDSDTLNDILIEIMAAQNSKVESRTVEESNNYLNAEEIKVHIVKTQKTYATVLFLLVCFSVNLAIAGIQLTYKIMDREKERDYILHSNSTLNASEKILRETMSNISMLYKVKLTVESFLSIVSLGVGITLYNYYHAVFLMRKVRKEFAEHESFLLVTSFVRRFLLELFACTFHLPPVLSGYVHPKLQLLVFVRIYLIGRYLQHRHNLWRNHNTRCMARLGHCDLNPMFLVKASFSKEPFSVSVTAFLSFLILSSYIVWLLEERFSYFDVMWMLIVAMTTVGYGDLYPVTLLGRMAVSVVAFVGIIFVGIFTFLAGQSIILKTSEKRVLAFYESKEADRHMKVAALNVIGMWYKYYTYKEKHFPMSEMDSFEYSGDNQGFTTSQEWDPARQEMDQNCRSKRDKFTRLKANMCYGITFWKMFRNNVRASCPYEDFEIEDIKFAVRSMSGSIDKIYEHSQRKEMMEKDKEIIRWQSRDEIDSEEEQSILQLADDASIPDKSTTTETILPTNLEHQHITSYTSPLPHVEQNTDIYYPTASTKSRRGYHGDILHHHIQSNGRLSKHLERVLADPDLNDCSPEDRNILIAFKLIRLQHRILNNAIETIYHKTRNEVTDIRRRLKHLVTIVKNHTQLHKITQKYGFRCFDEHETGPY